MAVLNKIKDSSSVFQSSEMSERIPVYNLDTAVDDDDDDDEQDDLFFSLSGSDDDSEFEQESNQEDFSLRPRQSQVVYLN